MTIGERLREIRDSMNLTQTEMCAGVVTESFYSRVENGKSEINIDDLLAILKNNHISVRDFFGVFDQTMKQNIQYHRFLLAINNHDKTWLEKEKADNPTLKAELTAVIASLDNKKVNLSIEERKKIKSNFGKLGQWNESTLWNLAAFMSLYDTNELSVLVTDIYEDEDAINLNKSSMLVALANVMVNYLGRLYQEDIGAAFQTMQFIKKLPNNPVIMFHKLVATYYQALLDHDQKRLNLITKVLQKDGYDNYLAWLPKR
ncbi:helix-turn-helix domain-containing protein [Lactobacillus crispatus]|uniref:helix-turn-helix domain-containing protein n=1 Tax=Lactobacillus crispatus TaxID=47770 RepID=UPI0019564910|nr:helix-turn-helix transcriptional regulator [Lactobacillus crispatus]MBM6872561.1 helix-turn-helix transcriptional regulator [Lactobacillus crispatus]